MMKTKSDLELKQDVIDAFAWDPRVNVAAIGVTVKDGIVTLAGHVASYTEKRAAEQVALRVAGVKAVAEGLRVQLPRSGRHTDADLAKAVVDALGEHLLLAADRLRVKVEKGVVTLEGKVERQHQRNKAQAVVCSLSGVSGVINRIRVQPSPSLTR